MPNNACNTTYNRYSENVLKVVREQLPYGFEFISLENASKEALIEKAPLADYFLASRRLGIDRDAIDAATKLKMIQRTGLGPYNRSCVFK